MKTLIIVLIAIIALPGCGASAYQTGRQDIARQYSELEQITDLGLRRQRFSEIQQREIMLESQEANRQQVGAQMFSAWMLSQGMSRPQTYNVNVHNTTPYMLPMIGR